MHSPELLREVLALKLQLTLCDPHETATLQAALDEKQFAIHTISKVPLQMVRAVTDARYPEFVAEQKRIGKLTSAKPTA